MNMSRPYPSRAGFSLSTLGDWLGYTLVLLGGLLVSTQLRLKVAAGARLGETYSTYPPLVLPLLIFGALCATALYGILSNWYPRWARFIAAIGGIGIFAVSLWILAPDFSQLQILYLSFSSILIAFITLRITPNKYSLHESLLLLWQNRSLLKLWVRYNILSRYSQTFLGILWIVMLPVATSLILTFVFSYIFSAGDIGNVPFVAFFLTGMMFWTLFLQGITQGTVSVVSKLGLINQIYFPREILVLVKLGEGLVDLSFVFIITLIINGLVGIYPNVNYLYLPILLLIQLVLMMGIMLFTSYLAVIVRDIQQLTTVFIQMMFYLTPVMYPVDILTPNLAELVKFLNPMAALINAYRDVVVYNRPPDFVSLNFPVVLSGVLFYSGYMFFKANERKLADFR